MKRFFLKHTTTYNYSNFVYESSNKLHLYPYNDLNQQIVSHKINIPGNPLLDSYIDDYNKLRETKDYIIFLKLNQCFKLQELLEKF